MTENVISMVSYPEGSLKFILSCYSKEDLGVIVNRLNIRGVSKLKKSELIEQIAKRLLDAESAAEYWMNLYDDELLLYESAMEEEKTAAPQEYDSCVYLGSGGYLFLTGNFKIEIPEELRELYRKVNTAEYKEERKRYQMIRSYIQASVGLYGLIPLSRLEEIVNSQNERKTDRGELVKAFQRMDRRDGSVVFRDGCFIDPSAYKSGLSAKLLELQGDMPYYVPQKEEFLKYSNPGYFEETPEYIDFKRFLIVDAQVEEAIAEAACEQIHYMVMTGAQLADLMEELDNQEIWFRSRAQLLRAREKVSALCAGARLIQNRGFSNKELAAMRPDGKKDEEDTLPSNIIVFPGYQRK